MTEDELTRPELLDKIMELRNRISEMEKQEMGRRKADREKYEALQSDDTKIAEELQLRFAQLKASEEELKQTRKLINEYTSKIQESADQLAQSQKLLKESDGHYSHLVENIPGLLAIQDVHANQYIFWNQEVGWTGHTLDEYNKLSYEVKRDLIHPDDLPPYMKKWQEWEKINYYKPLRLEYRLQHKDGYYRWIDAFYFREFDEDGTIIAQVELSWDITDRMEVENEIKARDENLKLLGQNQRDLVYRVDVDGKYLFVSPSFCSVFDKNEDELIGKVFTPPVHQDDFQTSQEALEKLHSKPFQSYAEYRVLTKDGWKWFSWQRQSELDSSGKAKYIDGVGSDISQRKQLEAELAKIKSEVDTRVDQRTAELSEDNAKLIKQLEGQKKGKGHLLENQAELNVLLSSFKDYLFGLDASGKIKHVNKELLDKVGKTEKEVLEMLHGTEEVSEANRRSKNNLQMLFDSIDDMIFILDSNGSIIHVNNTVPERLEYELDELLDKNILEVYPPNRRDEASAILRDTISGKTRSHSISLMTKDKTLIPVETKLALSRWDNNNVVIAFARDVTERSITDRKRSITERRFKLLAEETPVGACILQEDIVRYTNPHLLDMFGYSPEEAANWTYMDIEHLIYAQDREHYIRERHRQAGKSADKVSFHAFRGMTKSGDIRWFSQYTKKVTYESRPAELLTFFDITDFRKAEVTRIREEISRISSGKRESIELLTGSVAHDFNELLTIITGHAMMGMMSLHEGDPIRADLDEISHAAERGSVLTWKLLTCAGRHSWDPKIVDLNQVVDDMEKVIKRIVGEQVEVTYDLGENLGSVKADPNLLEQVMVNLATNSCEAITDDGKIIIKTENITVSAEMAGLDDQVPPGTYTVLSFIDNGDGMSKDVQRRIFDPFYTTKPSTKDAGLGLSIVSGIIKKSGGYILVDSEEGVETVFRIYMPEVEAEKEEVESKKSSAIKPSPRETVLVVDDDDAVREMALQILKWHGYKVLEASSGREALDICQKMSKPVDMVVSDVYMPKMSGVELVEKLKVLWPDVRVIYISGATADKSLDPDIPLLRKPFQPRELISKIEELLQD